MYAHDLDMNMDEIKNDDKKHVKAKEKGSKKRAKAIEKARKMHSVKH